MKSLLAFPVILALTLALAGCEAPPQISPRHAAVLAKVKTVAVLTFVDGPGDKAKGSGRVVVNAAIAELYNCPGLSVVETGRLKAIMDELDLQRMDQVGAATASKIGQRAGADLVILGEVTQYEAQQDYGHGAVYVFSSGGTKHTHRVGLSIRAVRVVDSHVVYAESGQGTSQEGFSPAVKQAAHKALRPWRLFYEAQHAKKMRANK